MTQTLRKPYLLFLADAQTETSAKTALGIKQWRPESVLAEWSLQTCRVTTGLPSMSPAQAAAAGAGSFVIGVAPVGGQLPEQWVSTLLEAIEAGLDIVSGMHTRLSQFPALVAAAARCGVRLVDVRHSDRRFPAATGRRRTGKRLLTVGTDCALGKKYTALALAQSLGDMGVAATFRATGQTGIMITGSGIAMDAVVSDFLAGAAEVLSPDNDADHWDIIEGQGALFHPAYAAVTLGLIHGSQPDALVLCHDPSRKFIEEYPGFRIPELGLAMSHYLLAAKLTNPKARFVGMSINSSRLSDEDWDEYAHELRSEFGLPVCDPVRDGAQEIASAMVSA